MKPSADEIVALHEAALSRWDGDAGAGVTAAAEIAAEGAAEMAAEIAVTASLAELVEAAHFANRMIWGLEDEARRRDVADARIAEVKRAIDPWNQRRNDLMEAIDAAILEHHANVDVSGAELHSETAGMMIDRLSILALKIRNVESLAASADTDEALVAECSARAAVLRTQREDLAGCLARLLDDLAQGRRHFRLYRQMKSYNDERLNPVLRAVARAAARQDGAGGNERETAGPGEGSDKKR